MSGRNIFRLSVVVLALSIQPAQAISPRYAKGKEAGSSAVKMVKQEVDPLPLPQDTVMVVTPAAVKAIIESGKFRTAVGSKASTDKNSGVLPADTLNHQEFRVQLLTTDALAEARKALRVAEEIFDQPVYLDYEIPYFKLRVGDFATRALAEKYLQKVKVVGYGTAWVVPVTVAPREAEPLYPASSDSVNSDSTQGVSNSPRHE